MKRRIFFISRYERMSWGPGFFGAIAPSRCETCGPIFGKVESRRVPGDGWYSVCPICDRLTVDYNDQPNTMRMIRRYRRSIHVH